MKNTEFNYTQFNAIYPLGIENHYWNLSRNRIIVNVLKKYYLSKKTILEIGCGRGIVVEYLHNHNFNIKGCDLAHSPVADKLKPYVSTGIYAEQLPPVIKKTTEVILLLDVIEHIENPDVFLSNLILNFPNAGYYLITVPACPELWSNYDEFNGHFCRYDMNMMKKYAGKQGFLILHLQYLFHSLFLPSKLLLRIYNKRNTNLKEPLGFSRLLHTLIASYLYFDYKYFSNKFKGTSLLMLMQNQIRTQDTDD